MLLHLKVLDPLVGDLPVGGYLPEGDAYCPALPIGGGGLVGVGAASKAKGGCCARAYV